MGTSLPDRSVPAPEPVRRRSILIFWLFLALTLLSGFTYGISRFHERHHAGTGNWWYQRGQAALADGRLNEAADDLRTALTYSRDNPQYMLSLARVLARAGQISEARAYLLTLWEERPGSGEINLELARLGARTGNSADAIRYYNLAIYGAWEAEPRVMRRETRRELVEFLLACHRLTEARAELVALTPDLSEAPELLPWAAQAFLAAGDNESALSNFRLELQRNHNDSQAAVGAGKAAFLLGRYGLADGYLKNAGPEPEAEKLLGEIELMRDLNPLVSRIDYKQRKQRLAEALAIAKQRMDTCPSSVAAPTSTATSEVMAGSQRIPPAAAGSSSLPLADQWQNLSARLQQATNSDQVRELVDPVMSLVLTIEQQPGCRPPNDADDALVRLYRQSQELER